jgi:transcriptional regulator with XRE-family HTH domain
VSSARRKRIRRGSRRPIEAWEEPHLERLGQLLRQQRNAASLTQRELGNASELSLGMICQIEFGDRRTRYSTLARIAKALALVHPAIKDPKKIHESLVEAAGPALATESRFRDRVDRRRRRRANRGRYGPREKPPLPGEDCRNYLRRIRSQGMLPIAEARNVPTR